MTKSQGDRAIKSPPDDQVQKTIAILKVELPTLFEQDISYDIYTPDIFFQDPVNTFRYKFNYRIIFWTLRFHGRLFFTDLHFDVHEVRQAASDLIQVDWTVRGTLRLPWRSQIFFNGQSSYRLREDGLIYKHIDTWDRKPGTILKQFLPVKSDKNPQ
ncbi:MAG: DUF2358 domain-containing protein [Leptolyngbyaceae cyanobacterium SM1_1_3]|nr:DUF2358 domain-containing protein [Leptolyngbyaceae cyanobacterium SM1_1_3]NJO09209.1 DUF2358 domain-containing protein [Leptolyngbyaceae cyanobacterium SL_1_1]